MYKGKTFIISGPSGVGKSTVLKELFQDRDDLYFSVSATTRPPRPGEINGVHYHFTDVDEFRNPVRGEKLRDRRHVVPLALKLAKGDAA